MKYSLKKVYGFVFVLLASLVISACAVNPVTGKKELNFMSEQQEIQMGAAYDPQVVSEYGLYNDEALQQYISEKGQAMARISHRPNLNWTFRVVDSPMVNAFAVPGGYVYFTRGIMAHFNNEAEFAGVLGHEIGHVTARHAARQQTQQTLGQALLIGGMIASKEVRQYADIASQGLGLLFLKFSRDDESQSDELGVQYSTEIGYDAKEMADFFYTLKRVNDLQGFQDVPTFLRTHPDPINRYQKVGEMAQEWQYRFGRQDYKVNRDSYLQMIDGIIYGNDPRQGFVENSVFYHPELKFQYPIPYGWQTQNSSSQVLMAPEDGNALMLLQLSPESSLDAAASKFVQDNQLQQVDARRTSVNGNSAIIMINDQVNTDQNTGQRQVLRIQSYCIQYGGLIYMIHGLSTGEMFYRYQNQFSRTQDGFRALRDPSKLNVKPERIKIVRIESPGTLSQQFSRYRMPSSRYEELAVLNGMQLDDQIPVGELIKIIGT